MAVHCRRKEESDGVEGICSPGFEGMNIERVRKRETRRIFNSWKIMVINVLDNELVWHFSIFTDMGYWEWTNLVLHKQNRQRHKLYEYIAGVYFALRVAYMPGTHIL